MKINKDLKVAIVGEGFFFFEGANRVNSVFCKIFPNADIYGLFGDHNLMKEKFKGHRYCFSKLQRFPFIKKFYKNTYFLWPLAIESFDLSKYDLVISSSYSSALGCIVPYPIKHISYIHTPMRYAWDLKEEYFSKKNFSRLKLLLMKPFLSYLRVWDVCAAQRPDILIANSKFVDMRMKKYWNRGSDHIINPSVDLYKGEIKEKRDEYFVTGGITGENKNGNVLLEFVKELELPLKVIGRCPRKIRRRFKGVENIKFLGYISDEEKYEILSKAKGYITLGVEDFGIFPIEAMSCGTPVLYYKRGGVKYSVEEGVSGIGIDELSLSKFREALEGFEDKNWNHFKIARISEKFSKERFVESVRKIIEDLQ